MLTRMLLRISITTALVMAWCIFTGSTAGSMAGAARGVLQGLVISAAAAIAFVLQTLAGRGVPSREYPAATQPDSVERQVFVAASSDTFVDMISLALLSAAVTIVYPALVPAAGLLIGIVMVSLVDFGIRYGLKRRSLVGRR